MAIDSECYCPDGEPKDSVDQDTAIQNTLKISEGIWIERA